MQKNNFVSSVYYNEKISYTFDKQNTYVKLSKVKKIFETFNTLNYH